MRDPLAYAGYLLRQTSGVSTSTCAVAANTDDISAERPMAGTTAGRRLGISEASAREDQQAIAPSRSSVDPTS
jgi:hypothetical protein